MALDHFRNERFQLVFHACFLGNGFLILLLPPAFQGAVTYEEFCFQLIRGQDCERSRTGKEVRRKREFLILSV